MRGGDITFHAGRTPDAAADWIFVADRPYGSFQTNVPKERRVLVLSEPPGIRKYAPAYLRQFGTAVSPYPLDGYDGRVILHHPCIGWLAGNGTGGSEDACPRFRNIEDVRAFHCDKTKLLSIVSSLKVFCAGHKQRIAFLEALQQHFGNRAEYFGREFSPVKDKLDAIAPYKYHIAIENSAMENYWTEKLTDAWIGWSLPLYYGDPAILAQVPDPRGLELIDIHDIPSALGTIERVLRDDDYASRLEAIKKCRDWAIQESNLLEYACSLISGAERSILGARSLAEAETVYTQEDIIRRLLFAEIEVMQQEGRKEGTLLHHGINLKISLTVETNDVYVTPL
jgi:hypothetical protein